MKVLVAYDVCTTDPEGPRRLRRVARACQDYGQRVQKSLFECVVGPKEWLLLRQRLLDELDATRDALRFYFLDATCGRSSMGSSRRGTWRGRWWCEASVADLQWPRKVGGVRGVPKFLIDCDLGGSAREPCPRGFDKYARSAEERP
jgi:CRISPR-associated protein Cas2